MSEASSAPRTAFAALVAAASLTLAPQAVAYCRTSSCANATGAICTPAQVSDCGVELFWASPCVGYSLQKDASSRVSLEQAEKTFEEAFTTWISAKCAGRSPGVSIYNLGPVACDRHEYNQEAGNANTILFRDDNWPYSGRFSTLALTTVTYNLDTGEIFDVDMELNSRQIGFTTGDQNIGFDLLSIATHEVGHFLGLAHSADQEATMFTDYERGTIGLRTLNEDDESGLCAAYPPTQIPDNCDATPRHGFSSECAGADEEPGPESCCTVAPGSSTRSPAATWIAFAALGLVAIRRRKAAMRTQVVPERS